MNKFKDPYQVSYLTVQKVKFVIREAQKYTTEKGRTISQAEIGNILGLSESYICKAIRQLNHKCKRCKVNTRHAHCTYKS